MSPAAARPAALLGILMLASAASMMATDLYAPSLPFLPQLLATQPGTVQLTLSLNLLAYAAGTLIHGPLSECFGRRPVLLWGMVAFTLTSLLCGLSRSIEHLLLFRVLQGLAAAVEGVVVLAIIRDVFSSEEQVRAMAWYGMATSVPPAVAPVLGAFIFVYFGWRMNFYLLALFALCTAILIARGVPESRPGANSNFSVRATLRDYRDLLCDWHFLRHTFIAGASLGYLYAFATGGPFLVVEYFRLPTQYFGYLQGLLVVGFVAGSYLAGKLAGRISIARILAAGIAVLSAGTVLFAAQVHLGLDTPVAVALSLILIAFAIGPIFATVPTSALDATRVSTGAAAAFLVAMEMGISALGALLVGALYDGTSRPLAITFVTLWLLLLLAQLVGRVREPRVMATAEDGEGLTE